jgi:hypothetical protein
LASIGALLVSAVHESTSEQRGNNKLEEGAMLPFDEHQGISCWPVLFIISACGGPNNKASDLHGSAIVSPLFSPRFAKCAMKDDGSLHISNSWRTRYKRQRTMLL